MPNKRIQYQDTVKRSYHLKGYKIISNNSYYTGSQHELKKSRSGGIGSPTSKENNFQPIQDIQDIACNLSEEEDGEDSSCDSTSHCELCLAQEFKYPQRFHNSKGCADESPLPFSTRTQGRRYNIQLNILYLGFRLITHGKFCSIEILFIFYSNKVQRQKTYNLADTRIIDTHLHKTTQTW